jgi:thymidylate synthase (FAD)
MKVTLTRVTENPIGAIEEAACNCYNSEPTGGKIMKSCYKSGHHSVLEFCEFTFHIEGVSRALTHQLVRHRLASYAQRSQRYCSEDGFKYITPPSIQKADEKTKWLYDEFMVHLQEFYTILQENGIPNEDARYILPNACETVIEVKMNLRSLIHFMNERLCTRAQWEIRLLALEMKKCVLAIYPELAEFLVPKCEIHKNQPFCPEHSTCGKHPRLKDIYDRFLDPKYYALDQLIQDVKTIPMPAEELADKFMELFCEEKPKEQ